MDHNQHSPGSTALHPAAARGFARSAPAYARGRPDYPVALMAWLAADLAIGADSRVVDLGAGTGKFTRLLLATGAAVTAIEPVLAMRAELANLLALAGATSARLPGNLAVVVDGTAEHLPLADGTVDVVCCAQAFHWFANRQALAEIHRVLAPGGRLGLLWNVRDESDDWVARISRIIGPFEGDSPRYRRDEWRRVFAECPDAFSAPVRSRFFHCHAGTPEQVIVDRFLSVSFIAALDSGVRAGVERQLRELITTHPALRRRERIDLRYWTDAWVFRRSDVTPVVPG